MVEFLVLVLDFPDTDLKRHTLSYHRGDVIQRHEDGFPWVDAEMRMPRWRIIRTPLSKAESDSMMEAEEDELKTKSRTWARLRNFDLDNVALPDRVKAWIKDDTRVEPILEIDATITRTFVIEKGDADDFTRD